MQGIHSLGLISALNMLIKVLILPFLSFQRFSVLDDANNNKTSRKDSQTPFFTTLRNSVRRSLQRVLQNSIRHRYRNWQAIWQAAVEMRRQIKQAESLEARFIPLTPITLQAEHEQYDKALSFALEIL